ncbi:tape measure protein [Aeromicrobium sp. Leaf291]|uniref:tape measure protein n=1 Tax=Aeromicrobium sp. Leaf291 TaxID=1736325 RepID=UPI0009E8DF0B|nr:tape measure protein [Aeromicrobium sp. Leaf291]
MAEVGSAYVSVMPSARGFESKLNKQIASPLDKAGKSGGQSLTAAFGKVAKTGMKVAAVGVGAVVGTALAKGFDRLKGIENAEAKLRGLGHTSESVTKIMDNALASVKGTAFGLDEAATVAAGAVASGVKPGKDLERTLSLVGDAATIGGSSLSEMGAIFNKVAASGKIQGDVIAQLGDQGIPILQLLAKQLDTTPAKVSELASKGKVDFATFQKAMEDGLGGAALESGNTFTGAFKNMNAALGRLGASVLKGVFPKMAKGFGDVTTELDKLGPAAERFGKNVGQFIEKAGPPTVDALKSIADAGRTVAPILQAIAAGFAALPGGAQKILLLAGAALVLKSRFDIATPSLANFDRQAALTTAKSVGLKVGALGAAAGLAALASKSGGASTSLGALSTVAAGAAAGFAVGGPWGAAFGAAGGVLSIFTSRSSAAAAAQERFKTAGAAVAATLNEQTGALTANTRATAAKQLADSGAFTAARKVGASYRDVLNAALGNEAAQDRVTLASLEYVKASEGNYDATIRASKVAGTLTSAVGASASAIADQRNKINQTNEALGKLDGKKARAEVQVGGLGGALAGLSALGNRLDSIIAKNAKVKVGNNAKGTDNWRGGLTWVGERGPELINLPKGSQVHTAQESKRIANMKPKAADSGFGGESGGIDPMQMARALRGALDGARLIVDGKPARLSLSGA